MPRKDRQRQPVTIHQSGQYQCRHCQARFDWTSSRPRGGGKPPSFCSQACANRVHNNGAPCYTRTCLMCARDFTAKDKSQRTCSYTCGQRAKHGWKEPLPKDHWALWYGKTSTWRPSSKNPKFVAGNCKGCGTPFVDVWLGTSSASYCSPKCATRTIRQQRKARKRGAVQSDRGIHWTTVAARDGMACHICGDVCDPEDKTTVNGNHRNGLTYPTVDHVWPLARGGTDTWDNVKLAHAWCNSAKSDALPLGGSPP